jgi:hypothetical protein
MRFDCSGVARLHLFRRWRGRPRLQRQIIAKPCGLGNSPIPKASRGKSIIGDYMVFSTIDQTDKGSINTPSDDFSKHHDCLQAKAK